MVCFCLAGKSGSCSKGKQRAAGPDQSVSSRAGWQDAAQTRWCVTAAALQGREAELGSLGYSLFVHLPSFTGDGVESEVMSEEMKNPSFVIPEKFESQEEMVGLNR